MLAAGIGALADLGEIVVADFLGKPHGLERRVAFDHAGGVIVDAFTGTRQQPRGGVVLIHDQIGVGLITLEGDAHHHLADGRAG